LTSPDAYPFLRVAPDPLTTAESGNIVPNLSVLVPVLDEAESVTELVARVIAVAEGLGLTFELVFVDDGSRDGTSDRVREANRSDPRVKLVRLRRNFGKAAALCAGFDHCRGRLVVTMDGDLQDDPDEIPRLLEALEAQDLDLVSGWKRQRNDPASKRWPSRFFNWVTRRVAQVPLHDFNSGFKV
jgi:glycosyltransferase involved in cell wall biosynthesis